MEPSANNIPGAPVTQRRTLAKMGAVVVVLAALGGVCFFIFSRVLEPPQDDREVAVHKVHSVSKPAADEAYVRTLASILALAREKRIKDTGYEVWWDNMIAQISELGEQVPAVFQSHFDRAIVDRDLAGAEETLKAWENVNDMYSFMGLSRREYMRQADDMRTRIGRIQFSAAMDQIRDALPDLITGPSGVSATETLAQQFLSLRDKFSNAIPEEEAATVFQELESRLTELAFVYLEARKAELLGRYAEGEDGAAEMTAFRNFEISAPTLTKLAGPAYWAALSELDQARSRLTRARE